MSTENTETTAFKTDAYIGVANDGTAVIITPDDDLPPEPGETMEAHASQSVALAKEDLELFDLNPVKVEGLIYEDDGIVTVQWSHNGTVVDFFGVVPSAPISLSRIEGIIHMALTDNGKVIRDGKVVRFTIAEASVGLSLAALNAARAMLVLRLGAYA